MPLPRRIVGRDLEARRCSYAREHLLLYIRDAKDYSGIQSYNSAREIAWEAEGQSSICRQVSGSPGKVEL